MSVAALFVDGNGAYSRLPVDLWDKKRDAMRYSGPSPVVAHPPCQQWVNLAAVNWVRYRRQLPAWYPGGSDGGMFAHALDCVKRFGGVLEHPAGSWAFAAHGLPAPTIRGGWQRTVCGLWVCEIDQAAYGCAARKRTWLAANVASPPVMRWRETNGTHQVGWFDRAKPTLGKRAASATPEQLAVVLVDMARRCKAPC